LGGFDISFVVVASLATFLARIMLTNLGLENGIWQFYLSSIIIGIAVGLFIG